MAPFATVYTYPNNFRVQRAQVVAALNGLELAVASDFQFGVTNKTPEFLAKFPMGKVPAMETADGFCLAEGGAICAHLAASGPKAEQLLGPSGAEPAQVQVRSRILEWSLFADTELLSSALPILLGVILKYIQLDDARYSGAVAGFERGIKRLEVALQKGNGQFLVGDQLTLADVMVAGCVFWAAGFLFDEEMRKGVPAVVKYLEGLLAIPEFKSAFGELKALETRVKP